jgi:hypothetical protein
MIAITNECKMCPTKDTVNVLAVDYAAYTEGGNLVQNVWPHFTSQQREIIMGSSNDFYLCSTCWDKCMGEED